MRNSSLTTRLADKEKEDGKRDNWHRKSGELGKKEEAKLKGAASRESRTGKVHRKKIKSRVRENLRLAHAQANPENSLGSLLTPPEGHGLSKKARKTKLRTSGRKGLRGLPTAAPYLPGGVN